MLLIAASGSTARFMAKKSLRPLRALRLNFSIKTVSTRTPKTANFKNFYSFSHIELRDLSVVGGIKNFVSNAQVRPIKGASVSASGGVNFRICFEFESFGF